MIHYKTDSKIYFIPQPSHAWLSGQLAEVWGNEVFGGFEPRSEVCLASAMHDIGWTEWERSPSLNPKTGWPYDFMNMPTGDHVEIWSRGSRLMSTVSEYAGMLVAIHNAFLSGIHDYSEDTETEARLMKEFHEQELRHSKKLRERLISHPYYNKFTDESIVERNRKLIGTWDYISLLLCMGNTNKERIEHVPGNDGDMTLSVEPVEENAAESVISPWPFKESEIQVVCDAVELDDSFSSQDDLDKAFPDAKRKTLEFTLKAER